MTIDWWTLGIQAVNVLILIWLLGRFFWKPMAMMISERRTVVAKSLAEAEDKQRQATDALADVEKVRAGFAREREAILAEAQVAAEQVRAAKLADAEREAAAMRKAAREAIAKEKEAAGKEWRAAAGALAVDIAERLLSRLDQAATEKAFLDWLAEQVQALPQETRRALASGAALEAVSAAPLSSGAQEACRTRIAEALGAEPKLSFRVDPSLIAGLELHGPHLVLRNSWRADLDHILANIADAETH